MRHELTEAELMDQGMSYEKAHEPALQTHPNNNWRRVWGMEPQ